MVNGTPKASSGVPSAQDPNAPKVLALLGIVSLSIKLPPAPVRVKTCAFDNPKNRNAQEKVNKNFFIRLSFSFLN
jgi:hypothetical protein